MSKVFKVYYLDDEPELCSIFESMFSSETVKVITFTDEKVATEVFHTDPPDLLFLDYRLKKTNGDLLAQMLQPQMPTFLISGEITLKTVFNFTQIFGKPIKTKVIRELIQSYDKSKHL
jgi:DNA-binding NtrC family response regulator